MSLPCFTSKQDLEYLVYYVTWMMAFVIYTILFIRANTAVKLKKREGVYDTKIDNRIHAKRGVIETTKTACQYLAALHLCVFAMKSNKN